MLAGIVIARHAGRRERVARARFVPSTAIASALRCHPPSAPPCGRARRPVTGVRQARSALPAVAPRSGDVATVTTAQRGSARGRDEIGFDVQAVREAERERVWCGLAAERRGCGAKT